LPRDEPWRDSRALQAGQFLQRIAVLPRHSVSGGHYFWINSGVGRFIGGLVGAVNIIGMLVLVVVGHHGNVEILGSRVDPRRKTCPSGHHPDQTGGANRKLLAGIRTSVREIAGARKRTIVMNILDLAVRHPDRLPPPLGNRGGHRSDRKSFAHFHCRKCPANFYRLGLRLHAVMPQSAEQKKWEPNQYR
jgi:hypothetical protein